MINELVMLVHPKSELSKNGLGRVRSRWAAQKVGRIRKDEREAGMYLGIQAMQINGAWDGSLPVAIEVEQYYSNKPYDRDGLLTACGPYLDGLVDAGVMKDDNPDVVIKYEAKFTKVKTRAENRTIIRVRSMNAC